MSEQITITATKDQIEDLKSSLIWNDIVNELESWRTGFNREMMAIVDETASTNPSTASVLLHMGDLNGRQKAVDYMIGILDVFLSLLEDNSKEVSHE